MKIITLKNNLKVLYHAMPNTHSVTVGLCVKAGSGYEDGFMKGASHLLEHLHFRRCGIYSQEELYYKMECIGSTLKATTYRDFMFFSMKAVPNRLHDIIKIFENLVSTSNWSEQEFEKEKKVVINQILNSGSFLTLEQEMRKVVFKKTSLENDIMGNVDSVESFQKDDVQAYKKQVFSPERMMFCLTGNFDQKDLKDTLKPLEELPFIQNEELYEIGCPKNFQNRKPDILLKNVQGDNLLEANISFDVKNNQIEKDLLIVLNCILGEGVGSRLQRIIREEKCYSTDIYSYVEWYSNMAVLHVRFSVEKGLLLECLNEIVNVFNQLINSISKRDLDVSLPFFKENFAFYEDDTEEMNFQLAYHSLVLETEFKPIALENNRTTISLLKHSAQKLFSCNCVSLVLVGSTKGITKKSIVEILKKLGKTGNNSVS